MTARQLVSLRTCLLAWFDEYHRKLPFRGTRDPYRVWVSEVMLQQTTVAAVGPYYERFISTFPDVQALAVADEAAVLRLWEGLGYYRRARHLHAAAKQLANQFGNDLPDDPELWHSLPGVGRYILGAVLSRSFDRKLPIVEANSLRLLARLFGYRSDPRTGEGKKWVWQAAERVLPDQRVGDFNEALMELGALVCSPDMPRCGECPLRRMCVARREGLQDTIPPKPVSQTATAISEVAIAIHRGGKLLLGQRPAGERWAGMWELPHGERKPRESLAQGAKRMVLELTGLPIEPAEIFAFVKHTVTRFQITMTAMTATGRGRPFASFHSNLRWFKESELESLPMPVPQRKLVNAFFRLPAR
jgi:A/G-specific adenine glycosylase